jgi:hypothetical protein
MAEEREYGDRGFDDQFNDGIFGTTLRTSRRERPHMWPKSVSEMRGGTVYSDQPTVDPYGDGTWHSDYMGRRGPAAQAASGPAFEKDSGWPLEGARPARHNGGAWYPQPYGPPIWISTGARGRR